MSGGGTGTPVKLRKIAGYGIGDFGFNLFFTGLNIYLLIYYTDVLGIAPATAGLIFGVSIFWDAVTDPIMALIVTRTRSRWGKFRPYLLFGAPLMAISFVMMFAAPLFFPSAVVAASLAAHLLFRTLYTVVNVPYNALSAVITQDSQVRSKLAGARMLSAVGGGLTAIALMPTLAQSLGDGDLRKGWAMVAVILAILSTLIILITFVSTRAKTGDGGSADIPTAGAETKVSLPDSWRFFSQNHALWIVIGAMMIGAVAQGFGDKSLVYYIKYNLGAEDQTGALLGLRALSVGVSVPFWVWFSGRTSKRTAWLVGMLVATVLYLGVYVFPPSSATVMMPVFIIAGFTFGALVVMFWSMLPDTVEYGQWKSDVRDEGIVFGLAAFCQKSGIAIGVAALGFWLSHIGYQPDVTQSQMTLDGIALAAFLVPAFIFAIVAAVIWFYPLDRAKHEALLADIAARKSRDGATTASGLKHA